MAAHILIVDDNVSIHDDFRKILVGDAPTAEDQELAQLTEEFLGEQVSYDQPKFELLFASDGQQAVEIVRAQLTDGQRIAMAFMDVRMPPGWDGIETVERIWQLDPDIQIVICTAYSDYGLSDIQKRLGVSDRYVILKKPFDTVEACQLASAMTSKWEREREVEEYCDHLNKVLQEQTCQLEDASGRLKEAERSLVQSEKLSAIGRLAAGIAHEMSTPACCITGNIELLRMSLPRVNELVELCSRIAATGPDDELLAQLKEIAAEDDLGEWLRETELILSDCNTAGGQVLEITRNLRDFARVKDDDLTDWNVNSSVDAALSILRNELKYRCVVETELGEVPPVLCVPGQMNQVFLNLINNASQAIEDGGRISIRSYLDGDTVRIDVTDDGKGMDAQTRDQIFEPFFTTKDRGQGTGLGLSIVHDIVTGMKGDISVTSELGEGAVFKLSFPAMSVAD